MKIQFLIPYTDPGNPVKQFPAGCTAEVSDPDGEALILAGIAKQVDKDIRARKTGVLMSECIPVNAAEEAKQSEKPARPREAVKDPGVRT